jgi:hypothetical protein
VCIASSSQALAEGEARAKGVKTGKGGERSSETASAALLLTNGADILLERAKRFDDHDECGGVFSDSSNDGGDDDDSVSMCHNLEAACFLSNSECSPLGR